MPTVSCIEFWTET